MKAVGVILILIVACLAAYAAMGGGDVLREAGRQTIDDVQRIGDQVLNANGHADANAPEVDTPTETVTNTTAPPPKKLPVVKLPDAISKASWGMSEKQVRKLYDINVVRIDNDAKMLLHKPKGETVSYRFILTDKGLDAVEVRFQAEDRASTKDIYDRLQADLYGRYSSLPDAMRTQWADGTTRAVISLDYDLYYVQVKYQSQRR